VFHLQGARFSLGPYINLGVWYDRYGSNDKPQIGYLHLTERLQSLGGIREASRLMELVDPWKDISDKTRAAELQGLIMTFGLPWFEKAKDFESAKARFAAGEISAAVGAAARVDFDRPLRPQAT
jgi:hypothetical protein